MFPPDKSKPAVLVQLTAMYTSCTTTLLEKVVQKMTKLCEKKDVVHMTLLCMYLLHPKMQLKGPV